jgi:hypothetical protein
MIDWIKQKLGISALEHQLQLHRDFVTVKIAELKDYTRVDADVGFRGNNTIILTGVYHNKGYVQFYDLGDSEFVKLAEYLKEMKKHALIRHIDAPPAFRGVFEL